MAKIGKGIRENTVHRMISGARVAFDPRTTEEVCKSVDEKNYKAAEKYMRTQDWQERQREQRRDAAE